jgi:hypothetical protein
MSAMTRSRIARFFLAFSFAIIWQTPAQAKSIVLDDSGTQALEPSVALRWKSASPSRAGGQNLLIGTTTIRVRINLMPYIKHTGRIYLSLPAQQPGPLSVSWTSAQGILQSGQMQSGNRALVYSGPITAAFLQDVLRFQFTVDAALIGRPCPVSFHFELDEG